MRLDHQVASVAWGGSGSGAAQELTELRIDLSTLCFNLLQNGFQAPNQGFFATYQQGEPFIRSPKSLPSLAQLIRSSGKVIAL